MRLLLDTHALLWWWAGDTRLPSRVRAAITRRTSQVFVSAVSAWEIAIKYRAGRLPNLPFGVERLPSALAEDGFSALSVTLRHGLHAGNYAQPHRDPFDRLLAAQSELEDLHLVTADPELASFPGPRLW